MSTKSKIGVRQRNAIALAWLTLNLLWLVLIILTDVPAWTLAVWIAATLGPSAFLANRTPRSSTGADYDQHRSRRLAFDQS